MGESATRRARRDEQESGLVGARSLLIIGEVMTGVNRAGGGGSARGITVFFTYRMVEGDNAAVTQEGVFCPHSKGEGQLITTSVLRGHVILAVAEGRQAKGRACFVLVAARGQ